MENKIVYQKIALHGLIFMFTGFLFGIAETIYFGSNLLPISKTELTCDFISAYVSGGGAFLMFYGILIQIIYESKEDIKKINELRKILKK